MNRIDLRLCGILDPDASMAGDLAQHAAAAARGGCTLVELRDGRPDARRFVEAVRRVKDALSGTGVPVLVAARVDVAAAGGADGVHLGPDDIDPADARRMLGAGAILGTTVDAPPGADALYRMPIDCCWVGPVFGSGADPVTGPPIGLSGLTRVAFRARLATGGLPVGAVGGIEPSRAGSLIGAGADGVAVRLATSDPGSTEQLARAVRTLVDAGLQSRAAIRS